MKAIFELSLNKKRLLVMNIEIFVANEPNLGDRSEIVNCLEYCLQLSPILGKLVIKKELEIDIDKAFSNDTNAQKDEVIRFNAQEDNIDNIHIFVTNNSIFHNGFTGLTVANLALVSSTAKPIVHPLIHEFGHTMGLVQPGMPNYFSDSEEERGGDPSNHCFGPLCIMSVRNIEAELRVGRYADYRTEPDAVFCKS
jgi:hypothetical protein